MNAILEKERMNIYLPKRIADDLREIVPARERTAFIVETLERELRRMRLRSAIRASYGAWKDEDHPELSTPEAIDEWIAASREGWSRDHSEEQ